MISEKLKNQMQFLVEADKMKTVLRRTLVADGSKREDDAEHSWHIALMAMTLFEYAEDKENINIDRVVRMALVHDLVEVYAGDTFCYDEKGYEDKAEREKLAADRLFSLLPKEQGQEYRSLWEEFDKKETPDALYASAVDCLQPLINNHLTNGHTWKDPTVNEAKVRRRMEPIKKAMPRVYELVDLIIKTNVENGNLRR